jgi:hypothetical protein
MASLELEFVGWIGAGLVVGAYLLLTTGKLKSTEKKYHLMNLFGSAFLGTNAVANGAIPLLAINLFMISIAIYGLTKTTSGTARKKK